MAERLNLKLYRVDYTTPSPQENDNPGYAVARADAKPTEVEAMARTWYEATRMQIREIADFSIDSAELEGLSGRKIAALGFGTQRRVEDEYTMQVRALGRIPAKRTFRPTGSRCPVAVRPSH